MVNANEVNNEMYHYNLGGIINNYATAVTGI